MSALMMSVLCGRWLVTERTDLWYYVLCTAHNLGSSNERDMRQLVEVSASEHDVGAGGNANTVLTSCKGRAKVGVPRLLMADIEPTRGQVVTEVCAVAHELGRHSWTCGEVESSARCSGRAFMHQVVWTSGRTLDLKQNMLVKQKFKVE